MTLSLPKPSRLEGGAHTSAEAAHRATFKKDAESYKLFWNFSVNVEIHVFLYQILFIFILLATQCQWADWRNNALNFIFSRFVIALPAYGLNQTTKWAQDLRGNRKTAAIIISWLNRDMQIRALVRTMIQRAPTKYIWWYPALLVSFASMLSSPLKSRNTELRPKKKNAQKGCRSSMRLNWLSRRILYISPGRQCEYL